MDIVHAMAGGVIAHLGLVGIVEVVDDFPALLDRAITGERCAECALGPGPQGRDVGAGEARRIPVVLESDGIGTTCGPRFDALESETGLMDSTGCSSLKTS